MKFLKNLDDLLHNNHMSRSDLARAIHIAPSTVNSWFNRSCENVSLKTLVDIAAYFNITLDDLVNGEINAPASDNKLTNDDVLKLKKLLAFYDNNGGKKV